MDFEEVTEITFPIRPIGWLIWAHFHFSAKKLLLTSSSSGYSPLKFGGMHSEPKISVQPFTWEDWWVYIHASPGPIGKLGILQTRLKSQSCWWFYPCILKLSNTISINTQCAVPHPGSTLTAAQLAPCFLIPSTATWTQLQLSEQLFVLEGLCFLPMFLSSYSRYLGMDKTFARLPLLALPCKPEPQWRKNDPQSLQCLCCEVYPQQHPDSAHRGNVFSCLDRKHNPQPRANPWTCVLISDIVSLAHNDLADLRPSMYKNTLNTLNCFKSCTFS